MDENWGPQLWLMGGANGTTRSLGTPREFFGDEELVVVEMWCSVVLLVVLSTYMLSLSLLLSLPTCLPDVAFSTRLEGSPSPYAGWCLHRTKRDDVTICSPPLDRAGYYPKWKSQQE